MQNAQEIQMVNVKQVNGEEAVITDSLTVGKVFRKRHFNVIRDIEEVISGVLKIEDTLPDKLFWEDVYTHPQNKQQYRIFYMTKDGFTLLAMGFTGRKALQFKLQYIEEFNRMERDLRELPPVVNSTEYYLKGKFDGAVEAMSKLVANHITEASSENTVTQESLNEAPEVMPCFKQEPAMLPSKIAAFLGISAIELNRFLHQEKVIKRAKFETGTKTKSWEPTVGFKWLLTQGYAEINDGKNGNQLHWTPKGATWIVNRYTARQEEAVINDR